jgi:AcrR family transcriptional regulator
MSPRSYQLGKRQQQVDMLRRDVVDAARLLLGETKSYAEFTIDAVAKRAGVARATVYYQFDSKVGLLQAVCDALAEGGRLGDLEAAFSQPDPMESIRIVICCFARFWDFDRMAMRKLRSLARLEPEVGAVIEERDDRRRGIIGVFVDKLCTASDKSEANKLVRVLTTLTSFETFDSLARPPQTMVTATAEILELSDAAIRRQPTRLIVEGG